jgi:hypothetical protein
MKTSIYQKITPQKYLLSPWWERIEVRGTGPEYSPPPIPSPSKEEGMGGVNFHRLRVMYPS